MGSPSGSAVKCEFVENVGGFLDDVSDVFSEEKLSIQDDAKKLDVVLEV